MTLAETAALVTRLTARASALVFGSYLAVHALSRMGRWSRPHHSYGFGAFLVAHTIHFGAVLFLAFATDGANLEARGGVALAVLTGTAFYAATLSVWRQQRRDIDSRWQIVVVSVLWVAFVQAYVFRLRDTPLLATIALFLVLSYAAYVITFWRGAIPEA